MSSELLTVVAGLFGVLITLIGALLARSISHIDTTIKGLVLKVETMSMSVNSNEQLRKFQNQRIRTLERNKEVLTDAFHEVDVLLEKALGKRIKLRRPPGEAEPNEDAEEYPGE
jgi:hypothetical protein